MSFDLNYTFLFKFKSTMNQVLKEEVQGTATVLIAQKKTKECTWKAMVSNEFSDSEIVASILDKTDINHKKL